ncbi:holo-ACP synthase [Leeia aquatica]|uniref:Holo-[acyl-carrier-protein] synthase n=1 Tax=Leeia aquatica TaxID=2725557 RepID=A0A847S2V8_9NEIS|nr:holo-ACP synthase [Leeia aquatica]NLR74094.1 holo-ACP synthase [Leeia aquatica]
MIYGLGTDLARVSRFQQGLERHGERFVEQILAPAERESFAQAAHPARLLAKRWAVKEAFGKAAGTGVRAPITLQALWLSHDALGRPLLCWDEAVAAWLAERGISRTHVSLSDEADYTVATVILEIG